MNEFEQLIEELPITNENKKLLPDFIKFIQGPESLKCLVGISQGFIQLLNLSGFKDFPKEAFQYKSLANEIINKSDGIQAINYKMGKNRDKKPKSALSGLLIEFPIYSLIYFQGTESLIRLQQAILTAGHILKLTASEINPYSYSLAIRELTDVPQGQSWLNSTNEKDLCSIEAVRSSINNLKLKLSGDKKKDKATDLLIRQLSNSFRFLDLALGLPVRKRTSSNVDKRLVKFRHSLGTRGLSFSNPYEYCELKVMGDPDDDTEYPDIFSLKQTPEDEDELRELDELGVEPLEADKPYEFIFVRHQAIPAFAQAFNDALRARGAAKRIELQNQFLPLSTQLLNEDDLYKLNKLIKELKKEKNNNQLLALLISCIFATSSNIERAITLQIVKFGGTYYDGNQETIGYDIELKEWLLPICSLELKSPYISNACNQSRNTDEMFFRLPDLLGFHKDLNDLYGDDPPAFPFEKLSGTEKKLRRLFATKDSRLTLSRVGRFMTLVAAGQFEATQATYLFSNYLSSSSARRYYTALSVKHYRYMYKDICQSVINSIGFKKILDVKVYHSNVFIGARYCPETEHVKNVLEYFIKELNKLKKDLQAKYQSWIEFHNLFTAYSVYAQGFLTGIRSVENPFISPKDILLDQKIAVFRDKDSDDQFHTRIIPLHPLILSFSEAYKKHRNSILVRLAALNPMAVMELSSTLGQERAFVFFLEKNGKWRTVRPKGLKKYLELCTNLPLNSNRKFIRNFLLEKNVSVHAIDTLLGHASRGEPFWGTNSTRSFRNISYEIENVLTQLAGTIGLKMVEGIKV